MITILKHCNPFYLDMKIQDMVFVCQLHYDLEKKADAIINEVRILK